MSLNRVTLVGRLTRDPEQRTTTTGKTYAFFGLAVRKRFKPQDPNERDADFFNIKCWGTTSDYAKNYLTKGRLIALDGRLDTRRYTDQQGQQRDVFEIVADNLYALDGPRDDNAHAGGATAAGGGNAGTARPAPAPAAEDEYDPFADE